MGHNSILSDPARYENLQGPNKIKKAHEGPNLLKMPIWLKPFKEGPIGRSPINCIYKSTYFLINRRDKFISKVRNSFNFNTAYRFW